MKTTTIIPNPSWGDVMKLLENHNNVRILSVDAGVFKGMLDTAGYLYSTEEEGDLTRFTLTKPQA